jgi:hypothetical protein
MPEPVEPGALSPMTKNDDQIPLPRPGFLGRWDTLIGPGSTAAEQWLILITALAGAGVAIWAGRGLGWSVGQWAVALIIALDLFGGVPGNSTASSKRWYHRPGQGARQHFSFVAVHFFHLLPVLLFFNTGWPWLAGVYVYLLLAATLILIAPVPLRRAAALTAALGGILLAHYALLPAAGLGWLLPVFYLKLLAGHLSPE